MAGVKKIVHFIGIGGIGMSALARWFKAHGYIVQGSDLSKSTITTELALDGIRVIIGKHRALNIPHDCSRVIYNQAIDAENLELLEAQRRHIPIASYPQCIGELTRLYKTIAIAGAHGKSTTTALIALILEKARFDPTVIIGTKLKEFGNKNFREGKGEYLVLEADEWKNSFGHYFPYAALITNIDREHLDYYKNLSAIKKAFLNFIQHVNPEGFVVLNKENAMLYTMRKKIKKATVWYTINSKEKTAIKKILQLFGVHNLSNAIGAYTLCRALGVKKNIILKAIAVYKGSWRRSEYRGEYKSAKVFDDYAHHPTEIAATIAAFKEQLPDYKLIVVFQPHQRERLKLLFDDFTRAFDKTDELILWEVYDVAGREEQKNPYNTARLADAITDRWGKSIIVVKKITALRMTLALLLAPRSKNAILMMGAGNINEITDQLIK